MIESSYCFYQASHVLSQICTSIEACAYVAVAFLGGPKIQIIPMALNEYKESRQQCTVKLCDCTSAFVFQSLTPENYLQRIRKRQRFRNNHSYPTSLALQKPLDKPHWRDITKFCILLFFCLFVFYSCDSFALIKRCLANAEWLVFSHCSVHLSVCLSVELSMDPPPPKKKKKSGQLAQFWVTCFWGKKNFTSKFFFSLFDLPLLPLLDVSCHFEYFLRFWSKMFFHPPQILQALHPAVGQARRDTMLAAKHSGYFAAFEKGMK